MTKGDKNFHDLVSSALGSMEHLQGYLDEVLALKYNVLDTEGFAFAPEMQIDFEYSQIQKELALNVMATYVDIDSPGKPIGTQGFKLTTGEIPRMKTRMEYDEKQMRQIMVLQERFGGQSDRALNAAIRELYKTSDSMIGRHNASLTYQRHQMVSCGKLDILDTNNPNGILNVSFSANIPDANIVKKTGTSAWWTTAAHTTEGSASDPIKDCKAIVRKAKDAGLTAFHFEIDSLTFEDVLAHSKVRTAIGLSLNPLAAMSNDVALTIANNLSEDALKAAFEKLVGAPVKVIDSIVSVEKWDNAKKKLAYVQMRAFKQDVFVLVPDGSLGEIKVVEPIKLPVNSGAYGEFFGGRLLMTVDFDVMKKIQYFSTEMTALVVPDKPQLMFYLNFV